MSDNRCADCRARDDDDPPANEVPCDKCGCSDGTMALHSCPYASEIGDNDEPYCNCCPGCTGNCADDV